MAIAAVIVLHGRAEKSNFIDIQGEKKEGGRGKKRRQKISPEKRKKLRHVGGKETPLKKKADKGEMWRDRCGGEGGLERDVAGKKKRGRRGKKHGRVDC